MSHDLLPNLYYLDHFLMALLGDGKTAGVGAEARFYGISPSDIALATSCQVAIL
jgi:hypothetical protein